MKLHVRSGFTLFEVIVASAFILALFQIITVFGIRAIYLQEIDQVRETVRNELASARDQAIANAGDDAWGVRFSSSTAVQFKGSSYAARDSAYDRVNEFGSRITITGDAEILFTPPYGETQASGTVNITNGSETVIMTINPYGTIEAQ